MLSPRAYQTCSEAYDWEEIWEAGPYYDRISDLLEGAQHYAVLVGWQIDSRLPFERPLKETLKEKVIRICENRPGFHFYFLMWDHAYFFVPEREPWQSRIWENLHPRVHFVFDNRHPPGASHHEKICIVDGLTALSGGVDLCGDRWDTPSHLYADPRRSLSRRKEKHGPYHDLAVQVRGLVCARIQHHVAERWRAISSIPFPAPPLHETRESAHRVYFSRTQSNIERCKNLAPVVREIEILFQELIASAQHRIMLEGQYFWSRKINDLLIAKVHSMRGRDFEIVIVLAELSRTNSLTRLMAPYETSLLDQLQHAASSSGIRLVLGAPYVFSPQPGLPPKPIYIHSKLIVVDDRYLCIGSANFAARALRIDTEVCLTFEARTPDEREHINNVSRHVLAHWGIDEPSSNRKLRAIRPALMLSRADAWLERPWRTSIRFQRYFDPVLPWSSRFRHRKRITWVVGAHIWIASVLLVLWAARAPVSGWNLTYALLLASAWFAPVPFVATALLAAMHLGFVPGIRLILPAIWIMSLLGYSVARLFPLTTSRYFARIGPAWLPERLGKRNFANSLWVLADPRLELRSKVAYQGLCCIPFPWFALGTWVIFPSALYVLCRLILEISPLVALIQSYPRTSLLIVLTAGWTRASWRLLRHRSQERTPDLHESSEKVAA